MFLSLCFVFLHLTYANLLCTSPSFPISPQYKEIYSNMIKQYNHLLPIYIESSSIFYPIPILRKLLLNFTINITCANTLNIISNNTHDISKSNHNKEHSLYEITKHVSCSPNREIVYSRSLLNSAVFIAKYLNPPCTSYKQSILNAKSPIKKDVLKFINNNYVLGIKNFFSKSAFSEIKNIVKNITIIPNCNLDGIDRSGGYIMDSLSIINSSIYDYIYHEDVLSYFRQLIGHDLLFPADFPAEYRQYRPGSRGMPCHSDLPLYNRPELNFEFVLTIDNPDGANVVDYYDSNSVKSSFIPGPNDVMIVRANSAVHCVGPNNSRNSRTFIKFVMTGDYTKNKNFNTYCENNCIDLENDEL